MSTPGCGWKYTVPAVNAFLWFENELKLLDLKPQATLRSTTSLGKHLSGGGMTCYFASSA